MAGYRQPVPRTGVYKELTMEKIALTGPDVEEVILVTDCVYIK